MHKSAHPTDMSTNLVAAVNKNDHYLAKINDEQFLYTQPSETLTFPEPELKIRHRSKEESGIQASSENEKSISKAIRRTQVPEGGAAVSQPRISGFRRCGGLSEY